MHWLHGLRCRGRLLRGLSRVLSCGVSCVAVLLSQANAQQASTPVSDPPLAASQKTATQYAARRSSELPDSPGTVLRRRTQSTESSQMAELDTGISVAADPPDRATDQASQAARASDTLPPPPCSTTPASAPDKSLAAAQPAVPAVVAADSVPVAKPLLACPTAQNPYQRFLNNTTPIPLTPRQKGYLALHNFIDPGNIVTVIGTSGIAIASDSHTAYGPGWRGFGRSAGISFVQDATGDFFGTFLIPAIAGEDPHYHRRPNASIPMRTLHAISRTIIAQGDDGHAMPNYATLLTYPITAEIANLYVPGVATNGPSTVERVLTGYATDPIDNLITEFLPDVAKRVHVRVIFVQQIINQVAAGQPVSVFP